jgi:hypothetical protein
LFAIFGGDVPLRQAVKDPEAKPYLMARVALNRNVLVEATVSAAGLGRPAPKADQTSPAFLDEDLEVAVRLSSGSPCNLVTR